MAQRPDAPTAPVTRLKTAGHVAVAATELEEGRRLALKEACRALFTASHRDDGINDADRLWCGHGVAIIYLVIYWTTCEAWASTLSLVKTYRCYRHHV